MRRNTKGASSQKNLGLPREDEQQKRGEVIQQSYTDVTGHSVGAGEKEALHQCRHTEVTTNRGNRSNRLKFAQAPGNFENCPTKGFCAVEAIFTGS